MGSAESRKIVVGKKRLLILCLLLYLLHLLHCFLVLFLTTVFLLLRTALLFIRRFHSLPDEDLRRSLKRIFVLPTISIPTVSITIPISIALLFSFQLLDSGNSQLHIIEQTNLLKIYLPAERRNEFL
jgi:hypothetical protein